MTLLCCSAGSVRADFKLPILNPVTKIISVPAGIDPGVLERFAGLPNLVIELRMLHGNLIPGRLMRLLVGKFKNVPKRMILIHEIKPNHADQIRKLNNLEVQYEAGAAGPQPQTENKLYSLGPLHKVVVLKETFSNEAAQRVGRMKFTTIGVRVRKGPLGTDQFNLLCADRKKPKLVILPASTRPEAILDLAAISPLRLEMLTNNNQLSDDLRKQLAGLRGVGITLVVNGSLTIEDVKKFTVFDRFSIKLLLDERGTMIPGLIPLLGKIGPP